MTGKKVHTQSYYGDRTDHFEYALFELDWTDKDPRLKVFCDDPYETVLHYTVNKDGSKNFIKVVIDKKEFIPK